MRKGVGLFFLIGAFVGYSCSTSPEKEALKQIETFLNKEIDDYHNIEEIEVHGPDSLFYDFNTAVRMGELLDTAKILNKKAEALNELVGDLLKLGYYAADENKELRKTAEEGLKYATQYKQLTESANWETGYFTIYKSFRHSQNGEPVIERMKFYFDESGNLLGLQNLNYETNQIIRLSHD